MTADIQSTDPVLQRERAVNERYQRAMDQTIDRAKAVQRARSAPRNTQWTGSTAPKAPRNMLDRSPIIGRVALEGDDPLLGRGFYLGAWHQELEDAQVVSWAAPVAALFYEDERSGFDGPTTVVARRTFVVAGADLVGYVDDVQADAGSGSDPFAAAGRQLSIPVPPPSTPSSPAKGAEVEVPPGPLPVVTSTGHSAAASHDDGCAAPAPRHPRRIDPSGATSRTRPRAEVPAIRAERAVRELLERPRTGALSSLLPTIQPGQYRLISMPAQRPLIVQGGPGTGKTIIAAHRAAYLVNPALEHEQLRHVGLVGPTQRYEQHVGTLVRQLTERAGPTGNGPTPGNVHVGSVAGLLAGLAGIPAHKVPAQLELSRIGSGWNLGRIAQRASDALQAAGVLQPGRPGAVATLVNALARGHVAVEPVLAGDPETAAWLHSMGSYDRAREDGEFLPLLAAAGLAVQGVPRNRFEHLVVDEGQDVTPIEWRILNAYLAPGGQFTIVGDMNQRRSDWSASSWVDLAQDLGISDDAGGVEVEQLDVGYRTTREILRFADRLLPRGERSARSLRSGPPPEVRRVPTGELGSASFATAAALASRHEDGLVAVICMSPRSISDAFRRHGWSRPAMRDAWAEGRKTVVILLPDQARGLEFDGVVVVEPARFPLNLGRAGQLYTSLTRAVQELVVLYSLPLPKELRSR